MLKKIILILKKKQKNFLRRRHFSKKNIKIAPGTYLSESVDIGRCTRINNPSYLTDCKVGAFCAIGGRLVVRSTNHRTNYLNMQDWTQKKIVNSKIEIAGISKGEVSIGNAVWIGDSVIILPGVSIGNGAVIGAGSVVTRSVPDYSIVVGNPAKISGYRFRPEIIDLIGKIQWWEWSDQRIRKNKSLFEVDMATISHSELTDLISKLE